MRKILLIITIISLPIISLNATEVIFKTKVNSARECAVCHYEMVSTFIETKSATAIAPYPTFNEVSDERICFSCHNGSVLDSRDRVWNSIHKNHKTGVELPAKMIQKKPLPLVDNKIVCATCHTPHGVDDRGIDEINNNLFLRQFNDKSELCINCHQGKSTPANHPFKEVDNIIYRKNIMAHDGQFSKDNKLNCLSCHATHGSSFDNLTLLNSTDLSLCKTCHEDHIKQPDVKQKLAIMPHTAYANLNDKILFTLKKEGKRLLKNNKLSCFTCHDIHNAKGSTLLDIEKNSADFCYRCHDGYNTLENTKHDMSKKKDFMTVDGKKISEVNICGACHGGHKFRSDKKFINSDDPERVCLSCHSKNATANDRYIDKKLFNHFTGDIAEAISNKRITIKNYNDLESSIKKYLNDYTLAKKSLEITNKGKKIVCTSCHDIHSKNPLFLRQSGLNGELCLSCHSDKDVIMNSAHGNKKLTASCVSCHKLHNNNNANLVRNYDKNDGCVSCHGDTKIFTEKFEGKKTNIMFEPMPESLVYKTHNHPTAIDNKTVFPDPMNNQDKGRFSCVSCHNPHQGGGTKPLDKNFLRLDNKMNELSDFCIRCHSNEKDIIGSDHDISPAKKTIVNKRTKRIASTCDNCHKTHNAETDSMIFNKPNIIKNDDMCISCHKKDGDAKDKSIDINHGHKLGLIDKINDNISKTYLTFDKKGRVLLECRTCHNPHKNVVKFGDEANMSNSFLKLPTEQAVCLNCHTDKKSLIGGNHDINNAKDKDSKRKEKIKINDYCSECHQTHNSDRDFLMVGKTAEERCLHCHKSGGKSDEHITASHISNVDMKNSNKKNLPLVDNKIICTTCHDPHNNKPALSRSSTARSDDLCISCHEDQALVLISPHNMQLAKITDKQMLEDTKSNVCAGCHLSHNFDEDSFKMTVSNTNSNSRAIEKSCISCHSSSGIATKVPDNLRHPSMMRGLENIRSFDRFLYDIKGKSYNKGMVDCTTCHNPHIWSKYKNKQSIVGLDNITGDNSTSFLKADVDKQFCVLCHEDVGAWFYKFHSDEERNKHRQIRRPNSLFDRIINKFSEQ